VHVVIMGCGRVGSSLALSLEGLGHSVAIIDQDAGAFRRLPDRFGGKTVTGVGFDQDTLTEAGIEHAASFAAVSSGDNSNIISARVARETFNVEHVVARIYDPKRAAVYQRLGIPTVATVRWTADQMLRLLLPEGAAPAWTDPSGRVVLAEIPVPKTWAGRRLGEIEEASGARVVVVTRNGDALLPGATTVVQEGDLFHFTVEKERCDEATAALADGPRAGKGSH
jgi:trk system potassium uptake protein TrkA